MSDDTPVADNFGIYVKMWCPHDGCGKMNYVYLGRMDDQTVPDREGMACWSCGKESWLDQHTKDDYGYESINEAYVEDGEETI